jgi:predicted nucleic acid-binding protein
MSRRYIVDANVVLRFLVRDHPPHAQAAIRLFGRAEDGEVELLLMPWIVAEIVYGLSHVYKRTRAEAARLTAAVVTAVGVVTLERELVLDALRRYAAKNVDFADAMLAAQSAAMKLQPASFDKDLDGFSDVERYEP